MGITNRKFLKVVLVFGLFFLNIVISCDAAPKNGLQAIVKDYSFRFDNKHTFITLDISEPVQHDIQTVSQKTSAIILKNSKLGEIDPMVYVDSDTLKNISFSETTTGDVKITLSLKNHSALNVSKDTKHIFIDIYPETPPPVPKAEGESRSELSSSRSKRSPSRSERSLPRSERSLPRSERALSRSERALSRSGSTKMLDANQTPNLKLAALRESIDELEGQEAGNSNPDGSPKSPPGFQNLELIGAINPLWHLQFFIDIILVLCIIILWRKYRLLNRKKKEFKTILAESQSSLSPEPSVVPVGQPVNEIPSFNQEVQTSACLDLEIGDEPQSLPLEEEDIREKAEEEPSQVTEAQKSTRRNLAKEEGYSDSRSHPPTRGEQVGKRIPNSERNNNSRAKNPPKREKLRADSALSKAELQNALAKISSQIEGLMDNKKDEQKQPLPQKDATSTKETIKRLAKGGMDVNSIAKKLGVPSGEVELILNLSDKTLDVN